MTSNEQNSSRDKAETGRAPKETIAEVARILQAHRERKRPEQAQEVPAPVPARPKSTGP